MNSHRDNNEFVVTKTITPKRIDDHLPSLAIEFCATARLCDLPLSRKK